MSQSELFDLPKTQTREEWAEAVAAFIPRYASIYGEVSADDVHLHMPPPPGVDGRVIGRILVNSGLRCIGYRKSTRSECHARPVGRWA